MSRVFVNFVLVLSSKSSSEGSIGYMELAMPEWCYFTVVRGTFSTAESERSRAEISDGFDSWYVGESRNRSRRHDRSGDSS